MDLFAVLAMLGGLALFLYGMHLMGEGLAKLSGGKLESILAGLTSKKIMAVLLGAGVTAVIQSSSATTVMVVGFVNSGIMKLHQAVGIIMGANVGTTVTSWILSLSGIESDSFFVQLLKPSSFSPVLAMIGVIFLLFSKSEKKKDIGSIMLGFAVLMFGMDSMSSAVAPLKEVPEFTSILTAFSNPVLGMLAGALLTAVIQSSSASVGILQALCATGAVNYSTVIPIIMGQNIGTCITALLSGIGASKNAKRTAFVHLYFNLIGTLVFMFVFYTANAIADFTFINKAAGPAGIALIHTVFNIAATVLLFPFSNMLEKLACLSIREKDDEKDEDGDDNSHSIVLQFLDERFLDKPAFALMQAAQATGYMANMAEKSLRMAGETIFEFDKEKCHRVIELEKTIDHYEDEIGRYLTIIAGKNLSENDGRRLVHLQHCLGDFERISDLSANLSHSIIKMNKKEQQFSEKALGELKVLFEAVKDMMHYSVESFEADDIMLAKASAPLEQCIDELNKDILKRHKKRLKKGRCSVDMGFVLADITTDLERISDHCCSVAINVIQNQPDGIEAHEYSQFVSEGNDMYYNKSLKEYREKFHLE